MSFNWSNSTLHVAPDSEDCTAEILAAPEPNPPYDFTYDPNPPGGCNTMEDHCRRVEFFGKINGLTYVPPGYAVRWHSRYYTCDLIRQGSLNPTIGFDVEEVYLGTGQSGLQKVWVSMFVFAPDGSVAVVNKEVSYWVC